MVDCAMALEHRVAALRALQGVMPAEVTLISDEVSVNTPHATSVPGVNSTYFVVLRGGTVAFHKPFSGVASATAHAFSQTRDSPSMHECAAWRLAFALGPPWVRMVPTCVLRSIGTQGEGSLCSQQLGLHPDPTPLGIPDLCDPAAFFDSLIGQQDRHPGNYRWEAGAGHLGLIDHGFAFARFGDRLNASVFVARRWNEGRQGLSSREVSALGRLVAETDLFGLRLILEVDRASALLDRAKRMLRDGGVLPVGSF
jgi:hypothetical protein